MPLGLPRELQGLLRPSAYPHPVERVELVETHLSWVLLAGEYAYKIKRPVQYAFVDLRDPRRREFYCAEELRLNRRFAPELYLGVCDIVAAGGDARIGVPGEAIEHAVQMRRFCREDELDRLLQTRRIEPIELEEFGRLLALTHTRLPAAQNGSGWGKPTAVAALLLTNLAECAQAAALFQRATEVSALRPRLEEEIELTRACMNLRQHNGSIRECHGDLHTRNIVRLGRRLVPFDCLEFEPAFRWIDVADELALLLSDLIAHERPLHAYALRSGYLAQSGDYQACRVLGLYQAHRALVRAKVAALSAREAPAQARQALRDEHARLLACARASLTPVRPVLLVMCGMSGSGKTWLARLLAERLNAIHLRSDIERKRAAALEPQAHTGSGLATGLYSREMTERVYDHLAGCAQDALAGSFNVIVDATCLRRSERARFRALARQQVVELRVIHCQAPEATLRTRVASRRRAGHDASEADVRVLEWQIGQFEAIAPDEKLQVIGADSTDGQVFGNVLSAISRSVSPGESQPRVSSHEDDLAFLQ